MNKWSNGISVFPHQQLSVRHPKNFFHIIFEWYVWSCRVIRDRKIFFLSWLVTNKILNNILYICIVQLLGNIWQRKQCIFVCVCQYMYMKIFFVMVDISCNVVCLLSSKRVNIETRNTALQYFTFRYFQQTSSLHARKKDIFKSGNIIFMLKISFIIWRKLKIQSWFKN